MILAVVDDDTDITILFRDYLVSIFDYTVFTFTNPVMALEHFMFNKEKYALVISDIRMPGLPGTELVRKLKTMNPLARTILMTAFAINDNLFEQYTKKDLINGFLQKPISLADLHDEVNNQLHKYELLRQKSLLKK
jgi:DNA-binding NtrC family response regulator